MCLSSLGHSRNWSCESLTWRSSVERRRKLSVHNTTVAYCLWFMFLKKLFYCLAYFVRVFIMCSTIVTCAVCICSFTHISWDYQACTHDTLWSQHYVTTNKEYLINCHILLQYFEIVFLQLHLVKILCKLIIIWVNYEKTKRNPFLWNTVYVTMPVRFTEEPGFEISVTLA